MAQLAQGTQIYALMPTGTAGANEVVRIECVTSFAPGGNPADQIEVTCLEETDSRSYLRGLKTPASATMGINPDDAYASHWKLNQMFESGVKIKFAVGWSNGKDVHATINAGLTDFVLSTTRTWFTFDGFISDFPFDFATNSVVSGQVAIQRTGAGKWIRKI
jgi:hypothetical protein